MGILLPKEMNGLSILIGLKRNSEHALSSFNRLMKDGWFPSVYAQRIARGIVDSQHESSLTPEEITVVHKFIAWAQRNRAYRKNRMKRRDKK